MVSARSRTSGLRFSVKPTSLLTTVIDRSWNWFAVAVDATDEEDLPPSVDAIAWYIRIYSHVGVALVEWIYPDDTGSRAEWHGETLRVKAKPPSGSSLAEGLLPQPSTNSPHLIDLVIMVDRQIILTNGQIIEETGESLNLWNVLHSSKDDLDN
jgi:hypothetical protein